MRHRNISHLGALVATSKQKDEFAAALHEIDPIPWPAIDAHFRNASADGLDVAGAAECQAIDASFNACPSAPVA
jgi:hypothetical protein